MPFFSLRILNFVANGIRFTAFLLLGWLKYKTGTLNEPSEKNYFIYFLCYTDYVSISE